MIAQPLPQRVGLLPYLIGGIMGAGGWTQLKRRRRQLKTQMTVSIKKK